MLLNALVQLGLSEKEASVYMMLLRIGPSPVSTLAKRLSLKRVTTYAVLDSLCKKAYVRYTKREKCRIYIPSDPSCLLESVERKSQNLKYQLKLARECVTKLQSFPQNLPKKGKSTNLYYGVEAEDRLMRELSLEEDVYILALSNPEAGILSRLLTHLSQSRAKVRICTSVRHFDSLTKHYSFESIDSISFELNTPGDLIVQEGKVIFLTSSEQTELSIQVDAIYSKLLIHLFQSFYPATTKI